MTDLPSYALSEEHELLRQTVRELAEAKIAPFTADVDEAARFPQEALDTLTSAGLQAVHIPEAHGGEGADALAAVIVIEEVARVCASSSLIPAVNKLGIKGSPTRTVILEDARIPADRIIGDEGTGFKTALAALDHTRITIAAQALSIAQGALDYATGYARERRQFGHAIADFQGVQFSS
jgi:alkylation response protein AidB-like acyl-CoA dehydrogenase